MKKTVVNMKGGHIVQLTMPEFREIDKYDMEKLIRIDERNIELEILTFPLVLSRLGLILAQAKYETNMAEFKMKSEKYRLKKEYRTTLSKPTNDSVDESAYGDPDYLEAYKNYIMAQKVEGEVDAIYWAAKDKSDKLNDLLKKLKPDEIMLQHTTEEFNTVKFRVIKSGFGEDYEKPVKSKKEK